MCKNHAATRRWLRMLRMFCTPLLGYTTRYVRDAIFNGWQQRSLSQKVRSSAMGWWCQTYFWGFNSNCCKKMVSNVYFRDKCWLGVGMSHFSMEKSAVFGAVEAHSNPEKEQTVLPLYTLIGQLSLNTMRYTRMKSDINFILYLSMIECYLCWAPATFVN